MTFRQLEFFITVVECKSINRASEMLNISQQAVSKSIRSLEEEMGCSLLLRTNGGVTLTNYGRYVLEEFKGILHKRDYTLSHVRKMTSSPQEPLLVGMSYGILGSLPPHFLTDFSTKHPGIKLTYSDYTDQEIVRRLYLGEEDLAVIAGPFQNEDLQLETVKKERIFLTIPREHELFSKSEIHMNDLARQHFVMFSSQFHIYHNFIAACRHAGFEPSIILMSNDFNSLREQCVHSCSLVIVPEHAIRFLYEKCRYVLFPDPFFTWDIMFATKKNRLPTEAVEEFYQHLKQNAQEDTDL